MKFQNFCMKVDTEQKIKARESLLLTFTNTKGEEFNISPDEINNFLIFFHDNYQKIKSQWENINSKKNTITQYEEKSYRAIYKSADSDGLKTISSMGGSQTKALTKLISKLLAYLTENEYVRVEENTFFDEKSISLALSNWTSLYDSTIVVNHSKRDIKNQFFTWMLNTGLSDKTAKSYSGSGIDFSDKFLGGIGFKKESLYQAELNELKSVLDLLREIPSWLERDQAGNSMYSSAVKKLIDFFVAISQQSFLSKPFLLLAGISGTGKTRFVREQASASNLTGSLEDTYCLVSVRPDWHEPSDLLGYTSRLSGDTDYVTTEVLQFLVKAWLEIDKAGLSLNGKVVEGSKEQLSQIRTFWLCLDEMNLAPVEQYFADYLSIMETREWSWKDNDFTYSTDPILTASVIRNLSTSGQVKLRENLGLSGEQHNLLWESFS